VGEGVSIARQIREWLATQDGPRTPEQIRTATGGDRTVFNRSIWDMRKAGILEKVGDAYKLGRPPVQRRQWASKEERQRVHQMERRRRAGQRPKAQYLAELSAETEARRLQAMVAKIAADNERARERIRKAQERHKAAGRINVAITPKAPSVIELSPPKPALPCTEAWIAAGNRVEVLPSNLGAAYAGLNSHRVSLY
jgi:hypothetical protein